MSAAEGRRVAAATADFLAVGAGLRCARRLAEHGFSTAVAVAPGYALPERALVSATALGDHAHADATLDAAMRTQATAWCGCGRRRAPGGPDRVTFGAWRSRPR